MNHREIRATLLKMQSEVAKRLAAIDAKIDADGVTRGLLPYDGETVTEYVKDAFTAIDEEIENLDAELV